MKVDNVIFEVGNSQICISKDGINISTDDVFLNGELIESITAEDISSGKINTEQSTLIKVGGVEYEVIYDEYFKAYDDDRNLWGCCDYEQQKIYIRKSLSTDRKKQVLIHELTHAIFHEAGYKEQDEEMISRVSLILHQVLNENNI